MFSRQLFEVFHDGYWYGQTQSPPPSWYLIAPSLSDVDEIVRWKIKEYALPVRESDGPGRGIPFVNTGVADSILITSYSKREIEHFLSALNISIVAYDFKSVQLFQPKANYQSSVLYEAFMPKIRRSVSVRTSVRQWFR